MVEDKIVYTYKSINESDVDFVNKVIIKKENLIKPEDLHKHVGEILMFHNGRGYVVSGILKCGDVPEFDEYSYKERSEDVDYEDELDMCWFNEPNNEVAEYITLEYAYVLKVQNIHHDELMHYIKYIAIPTEEELAFREKILLIDNDELTERYIKLKELYD